MYLTSSCLIISGFGLLWCTTTLADSEAANVPRQLLKKKEAEEEEGDNDNRNEDTMYSYSLFTLYSIIIGGDQNYENHVNE